jgi:hypothetical protein
MADKPYDDVDRALAALGGVTLKYQSFGNAISSLPTTPLTREPSETVAAAPAASTASDVPPPPSELLTDALPMRLAASALGPDEPAPRRGAPASPAGAESSHPPTFKLLESALAEARDINRDEGWQSRPRRPWPPAVLQDSWPPPAPAAVQARRPVPWAIQPEPQAHPIYAPQVVVAFGQGGQPTIYSSPVPQWQQPGLQPQPPSSPPSKADRSIADVFRSLAAPEMPERPADSSLGLRDLFRQL